MPINNQALQTLLAGNKRFINKRYERNSVYDLQALDVLSKEGQNPMAAVLTCSDSRIALEVIFDQPLGSLFVVRVAGHASSSDVIGSLDYAISVLNVNLVLVIGHTHCGAIRAAIDNPRPQIGDHLSALISKISGAIAKARKYSNSENLEQNAIIANVSNCIQHLLSDSSYIRESVENKTIDLIGAIFNSATGKVTVLDSDQAIS